MHSLTDRDIETLRVLLAASDDAFEHDTRVLRQDGWVTPMDCGGFNGSHHSYTLSKLARLRLAERYKFGGKHVANKRADATHKKGSCRYRISVDGRAYLLKRPRGSK